MTEQSYQTAVKQTTPAKMLFQVFLSQIESAYGYFESHLENEESFKEILATRFDAYPPIFYNFEDIFLKMLDVYYNESQGPSFFETIAQGSQSNWHQKFFHALVGFASTHKHPLQVPLKDKQRLYQEFSDFSDEWTAKAHPPKSNKVKM